MPIALRIPFEKFSSLGEGSFGTRKFRKIERFSPSALVYGRIKARKAYVLRNALALPLKSTCSLGVTTEPTQRIVSDGSGGIASALELYLCGGPINAVSFTRSKIWPLIFSFSIWSSIPPCPKARPNGKPSGSGNTLS